MSIVTGFTLNPQLHRYGKLCKREHDHEGTGKSLRYKCNGACLYCDDVRWRAWDAKHRPPKIDRKAIKRVFVDWIVFDSDIHKMSNTICVNGHDHQGLNQTIRYKTTGTCVYCLAERRELLQEKLNADDRARWHSKTAEEKLQISRENRAKQDPEKIKEYFRAYRATETGRANIRASTIKFRCSPKGRLTARLKSHKRRMRIKSVFCEHYLPEQIQSLKNYFGNCCAYCGVLDNDQKRFMQIDHVIPISRKGADRIENLVPACIHCNASKNDTTLEQWYIKKDFATLEKLKKVLSILGDEELKCINQDLLTKAIDVLYVKSLHNNVLT